MDQGIILISRLSGVPVEALDNLDLSDYHSVATQAASLLQDTDAGEDLEDQDENVPAPTLPHTVALETPVEFGRERIESLTIRRKVTVKDARALSPDAL